MVEQVGHNDTTGGDADNAIGGTGNVMMILLLVMMILLFVVMTLQI